MRILILGGTTFFGLEIVRQLVREGHAVTIFTRGQKELPPELTGKVDQIEGDRKLRADLARAADAGPWDAVIDNIAYTPDDVRMALDLFADTGRYVFTSTASVYHWAPPGTTQPLDEESVDFDHDPAAYQPDHPGWSYAYGKVYAEKVLRQEDRIPWTIIRPPVVLGPNDPTLRGYWYFARLMDGGPLLLANGGANGFRLAFSEDLAATYLRALRTERAVGRTYNAAQPEIVTLRELLETAAEALGVEPNFVDVPAGLLQRENGDLSGPYGVLINFIPSVERVRAELGYTATPFADWLSSTARWYRDEFTGDAASVLETRNAEIAFAQRWRRAIAPFIDEVSHDWS